jgi:hypothetical protein
MIERGLMNKGAGYTDEVMAPEDEYMCRARKTVFNQIEFILVVSADLMPFVRNVPCVAIH